jgi:hypothetical protein
MQFHIKAYKRISGYIRKYVEKIGGDISKRVSGDIMESHMTLQGPVVRAD